MLLPLHCCNVVHFIYIYMTTLILFYMKLIVSYINQHFINFMIESFGYIYYSVYSYHMQYILWLPILFSYSISYQILISFCVYIILLYNTLKYVILYFLTSTFVWCSNQFNIWRLSFDLCTCMTSTFNVIICETNLLLYDLHI